MEQSQQQTDEQSEMQEESQWQSVRLNKHDIWE